MEAHHPTVKFYKIAVCLLLFLGLAIFPSCTTASPKETIESFFSAAKNYDNETLSQLVATEKDEVFFWGLNDSQFSSYNDSLARSSSFRLFYRFCAKKLTYRILECKTDGNIATVTAECRYVDGSDAVLTLYSDALNTMTLRKLEGKFDPNFDYYDQAIVSRIQNNDEKYLTSTLQIRCTKTDSGWKIHCSEPLTEVITACLFPPENKNSEAK